MPQWLIDFGNWLYEITYAAVATIGVILENVLLGILNGFFLVGQFALSGIGTLLEALNVTDLFGTLPPEFSAMLGDIGLSQALGMIVTALGIRLVLQLIPFTRLGS